MHGEADLSDLLAHDLDDDPGRVCHAFGGIGAARSKAIAPSLSWTEAA